MRASVALLSSLALASGYELPQKLRDIYNSHKVSSMTPFFCLKSLGRILSRVATNETSPDNVTTSFPVPSPEAPSTAVTLARAQSS